MRKLSIFLLGVLFLSKAMSQNWVKLASTTTQTLNDVWFVSADNGWAVGDKGLILHTQDGGNQWQVQSSGTQSKLLKICFIDPNKGFAISSSELFKTTDAGQTWTLQDTLLNAPLGGLQFVGQDSGFAMGYRRMLRTSDGGVSWTKQHAFNDYVASFWACNSKLFYAGGPDYAVFKSFNGGINWELIHDYSSVGAFYGMHFTNNDIGYVVGGGYAFGNSFASIFMTDDGGLNWSKVMGESSNHYTDVHFSTRHTGYVTSTDGAVWKTTDEGFYWTKLATGNTEGLLSIYFIDSLLGYAVGYKGTILKTSNGGMNTIDPEKNVENGLRMFPNPVIDRLTIQIQPKQAFWDVSIWNAMGSEVFAQRVYSSPHQIDLSQLRAGTYIMRVSSLANTQFGILFKQ